MKFSQLIINKIKDKNYKILFFIGISLIYGLFFGYALSEINKGILNLLISYKPNEPSILYDIKGRPISELYVQKFETISLEKIPSNVIHTFITIEDNNFYHHFGFDILGIIRASFKNLISLKIVQGGSTLTQQVAKMIYINVYKERKKSFIQKFRELLIALYLEHTLSKEEILELYLNMVYFGHGCNGISCASKIYFNKAVENLTIGEAAILARLPKSPVYYSPFKYPENSKEQHRYVLSRLVSEGFLTKKESEKIFQEFWDKYWGYFVTTYPSKNIRYQRLDKAPYFTKFIEEILKKTPEVGESKLYSGGLKIYTTLDLDLQTISNEEMLSTLQKADIVGREFARTKGISGVDFSLFEIYQSLSMILPVGEPKISSPTLEQQFSTYIANHLLDSMELLSLFVPAVKERIAFVEERKKTLNFSENLKVEGALLIINHNTGGILAMIGGREFSPKNQFNRALFARRQPGSSFKIFVYGAGIESQKMNSMTPLSDLPFQIISNDGTVWSPANYEGDYSGLVPATTAFAYSLNTCAVDVYRKIGGKIIIEFAEKLMKITNPHRLKPIPTLALGAFEITPAELATATAIIANQGREVIPYGIRFVKDADNNMIYSQENLIKENLKIKQKNGEIQIINRGTAYILRKMMEEVVNSGTLSNGVKNKGNFYGDLAGKTGTTSSWSDAWVTSFNPDMTTTIWFGFDRAFLSLGHHQTGGSLAGPTLGKILKRYYDILQQKPPSFSEEKPPEVEIFGCAYGLAPQAKLEGTIQHTNKDHICSIVGGIKDEREILMEELGITPEDLGIPRQKKLKFQD